MRSKKGHKINCSQSEHDGLKTRRVSPSAPGKVSGFSRYLFSVYCKKGRETRTLRPYFCKNSLPCKGRWVAVTATRRDFLKKIDFKKKVFRFLIPQSSSMTAPDGSPSPLSLRDISPHRGESPFTREPNLSPLSAHFVRSRSLTGESLFLRLLTFYAHKRMFCIKMPALLVCFVICLEYNVK